MPHHLVPPSGQAAMAAATTYLEELRGRRLPVMPSRDGGSLPRFFTRGRMRLGSDDDEEEQRSINPSKRARVPASDKAIQALEEVAAAEARLQAECAVCLQDFRAEDKLRAMPCSHNFHQDCIFGWLRVNHVCPLCRHALPAAAADDDDEEEFLMPMQQDFNDDEVSW